MTDQTSQVAKAGMSWAARRLCERLTRRFYAGVYNYLRWLCRDAELAEDLTQETFLQMWRHPPELRGEKPLKAWVFKVARNEFLQHQRRSGLHTVALEENTEAQEVGSASTDPAIGLEREALCQAVQTAVERLPALYREVIVLHNMEGLPLARVAEVLGIPKGTVKSRRAKAVSLLRHMLREHEVIDDEVR